MSYFFSTFLFVFAAISSVAVACGFIILIIDSSMQVWLKIPLIILSLSAGVTGTMTAIEIQISRND